MKEWRRKWCAYLRVARVRHQQALELGDTSGAPVTPEDDDGNWITGGNVAQCELLATGGCDGLRVGL